MKLRKQQARLELRLKDYADLMKQFGTSSRANMFNKPGSAKKSRPKGRK